METDTDFTDGEQYELTVTAVSARGLDIGGTRVTRHTLEDGAGEQFAVLVAPDSGGLVPLEPGETYRVRGLVGARPPGTPDDDTRCPSCGSPVRAGRVPDTFDGALADAVERLQVTEPFGIVSERTVLTRLSNDSGVDDWLLPDSLEEHERESVPLVVSEEWVTRFERLRGYLATEREVLGDETLEQERALLGQILDTRDEQEGR